MRKVENWEINAAPSGLIRSSVAQSEMRFLEYRLDVIRSWPHSARKEILMEAVALRLNGFAPGLGYPAPEGEVSAESVESPS